MHNSQVRGDMEPLWRLHMACCEPADGGDAGASACLVVASVDAVPAGPCPLCQAAGPPVGEAEAHNIRGVAIPPLLLRSAHAYPHSLVLRQAAGGMLHAGVTDSDGGPPSARLPAPPNGLPICLRATCLLCPRFQTAKQHRGLRCNGGALLADLSQSV